ncbi:MAG: hypothetical protein WBE40_08145 [Thermoplasmata archaeon]
MQQQQPSGFRRFLQKPVGKALLLALAILVVFATYVYVDTLVAIPAMLLFGLAVPIWSGLKAPRYLALSGLVILLLVAPISNLVITQDIMTPVPASSSSTSLPSGNGGAVLQNAVVTPYVGGTATNFTWTVTVFPNYVPPGNSTPLWLNLYVSSCPGATGNDSPVCTAPYPITILNYTFASNTTTETNVSFHLAIGSVGIWDWQMSVTVSNTSTHALAYIFLVGDPTYNGIEGPVVGDFTTTYASLLLTLYFDDFLFLGAPFYFVLLIYMIFKRRERTRADAARRAAGPPPAEDSSPSLPNAAAPGRGPPAAAPVSSAAAKEGSCPSCGAVVYANEKTCWKCGADLSARAGSAPLPSGKSN